MAKAPKLETDHFIKGSNKRTYKENPDGRLTEVYIREDHAQRLLDSFPKNPIIMGLRITDANDPDAPAVVVNLDKEESATLLKAVSEILTDRTGS